MQNELTAIERALIAEIGAAHYYFEGPDHEKADRQEFRRTSVFSLRRALEKTFIAGRDSVR
jgi:hypothetical protein